MFVKIVPAAGGQGDFDDRQVFGLGIGRMADPAHLTPVKLVTFDIFGENKFAVHARKLPCK
jgi:hypothetical protein